MHQDQFHKAVSIIIPQNLQEHSTLFTKPVVSRVFWKPFNRMGNHFFFAVGNFNGRT